MDDNNVLFAFPGDHPVVSKLTSNFKPLYTVWLKGGYTLAQCSDDRLRWIPLKAVDQSFRHTDLSRFCTYLYVQLQKDKETKTTEEVPRPTSPTPQAEVPVAPLPNIKTVDSASESDEFTPRSAAEEVDIEEATDNVKPNEGATSNLTQQNVTFRSTDPVYGVDATAERDSTYNDGETPNIPLGEFLSRPVTLTLPSPTWTLYTTYTSRFDPTILWQSDARVKAKLENYAYVSFDLVVRFLINSSPFHYGKLIATWVPYGEDNQVASQIYDDLLTSPTAQVREAAMMALSTYPSVELVAGKNVAAEMKLPFIWHNNFLSVAGTTTDAKEGFGQFYIYDLNPLRAASATASTAVNIKCYAHPENLKMSGTTEFEPTSKPEPVNDDEYPDGAVSSIASAVADKAGALTKVPVIGPFARATQIGAGAMADIGRLFGFSKPVSLTDVDLFQQTTFNRMATTKGSASAIPLSLDPKQEITVDPRTVGVAANDEMAISSIVSRRAWLSRASWASDVGVFTTAGVEKILFSSVVTPDQVRDVNVPAITGTPNVNVRTPAGHVGRCFKYWKGAVTYTVEVVASKYHSGRLLLSFDPFVKNGAYAATDAFTENVNGRFSMVLDLEEAQCTDFTIDYISRRPLLNTSQTNTHTFQPRGDNDTTYNMTSNFDDSKHMGMFSVTVINELVAPIGTASHTASSTSAPVYVNVYVRASEDLFFGEPHDTFSQVQFVPRSQSEAVESSTSPESAIMEASMSDANASVFFGERVFSIRELMKRATVSQANRMTGTPSNQFKHTRQFFPHFSPQYESTTEHRNTFESYFTPMFLTKRGSVRIHLSVIPLQVDNYRAAEGSIQITRFSTKADTLNSTNTIYTVNSGSSAATIFSITDPGPTGTQLQDMTDRTSLEVQIPWYNSTRFALGTQIEVVGTNLILRNPSCEDIHYFHSNVNRMNADSCMIYIFRSVGEDFSCSFFLGAPPAYRA